MEIKLKYGIANLLFGMKPNDVEKCLGKPDKKTTDDDKNTIYIYTNLKLKLTFYIDEELRFGYFATTNPSVTIFNVSVISKHISLVMKELENHKITKWETSEDENYVYYFNESNWITLQTEFDEVVRVEIGAVFNEKEDEFDWKYL